MFYLLKMFLDTVAEELPGIRTKEVFIEIAGHQSDWCVSVYIGTHNAGVEDK
jgi:hypothetical protein